MLGFLAKRNGALDKGAALHELPRAGIGDPEEEGWPRMLGPQLHRMVEREARGGYQIVAKQAAPTVSWLKTAREDLVAIYSALHQPEQAETFRAEAARVEQASATPR